VTCQIHVHVRTEGTENLWSLDPHERSGNNLHCKYILHLTQTRQNLKARSQHTHTHTHTNTTSLGSICLTIVLSLVYITVCYFMQTVDFHLCLTHNLSKVTTPVFMPHFATSLLSSPRLSSCFPPYLPMFLYFGYGRG